MTRDPARVLVAMSGGVDSSVAAALLLEQGHEVTGVTLKLWGGASDSGCCSVSDVEDARRVAAQLGIPHYVFNFADEFDVHVVEPYVRGYEQGMTPNPCVECNRSIKFGRLLARADALGFDALATGHHARVAIDSNGDGEGAVRLLRGRDGAKDQSYVLYMLGARELTRTLLPVGDLTKAEVRDHAARLGLRTATKAESMDVCFITRGGRESFLDARTELRAGPVVDTSGAQVGEHSGVAMLTIGQRRGLGVATGERRYVVDVDAPTATVTIGTKDELLRDEIRLRDLCFVHGHPGASAVTAQASAHGRPVAAVLDGDVVRLAERRPRVAPGQVVALYDGDELVGGGLAR
jgi:tRNA-specific 2-thiouridylase